MFTVLLKPWHFFKRQPRTKKIIIIVVIGLLVWFGFGRMTGGSGVPEYEVEAARYDSVVEMVSETGNITTTGAVPVYSTTTGIVEDVYVNNGSFVTDDQVLFRVKSTATKQEQEAALAAYMTAKNQYQAAQANQLNLQAQMFNQWDQFKELAESDEYEDSDGNPRYEERGVAEFHVQEKEWLSAEEAYKNQQQIINQASINASAAWRAYQATQDSEITALFDGQVKNLAVARGDLVTVSTNPTTGNPALLVVSSDVATIVQLSVGETDAIKIEPGQPAQVEVDALPGQILDAYVDRVDTVAVPNQGVVNYSVYVVLNQVSESVRSGMTASVDITVASKENVLTVPSSAVKPHEGARAVRVVGSDGQIEFIPVEVGAKGGGRTEIISGIEEGTQVIVALSNDQVGRRSGGFF